MLRDQPGEGFAECEVVFGHKPTRRRNAFAALFMLTAFLSCSRVGDKPPWWPKEQVAKPKSAPPACASVGAAPAARPYFWTDPEPDKCADLAGGESQSSLVRDVRDAAPPGAHGPARASAARVVEAMRERFRDCYQALLDHRDACAAGTVRLKFHIQCEGKIQSMEATASGVDGTTVQCMFDSAKQSRFEPPPQRRAVVSVPVRFVRRTAPPTATPAPDAG
jgi:hypothetical protein